MGSPRRMARRRRRARVEGPGRLPGRDVEGAARAGVAWGRVPQASLRAGGGGRAGRPDRDHRRERGRARGRGVGSSRASAARRAGRACERDAARGRAGGGARHRPRVDREGRLHHRRGRRAAGGSSGAGCGGDAPGLFAGISLEGVSLPAVLGLARRRQGRLDEGFLESLRSDPDAFRALLLRRALATRTAAPARRSATACGSANARS